MEAWIGRTAVGTVLLLAGCAANAPASSPAHVAASHGQGASAAPIASASDDPTACAAVEPEGEPFELAIETVSYAFDTELIEGPRHCQPFVITFTNNDEQPDPLGGTNEHDIDIRAENLLGPLVFDGDLVGGGGTIRYEVPGLPAGEHYFYCSQHADAMSGTVVVGEQ